MEAVNAMYTQDAEEHLLRGKPDFVLDAIDNIDTKVALLAACHRRGIPVLSSAGAGWQSKKLFCIVSVAEAIISSRNFCWVLLTVDM